MSVSQPDPTEVRTTGSTGGLTVITEQLPYVGSVALGVAYRLGSRDDPAGKEGTAHLIEHMVFKGTDRLSGRELNIAAESRGAELNAFTDKEMTFFYGRFPGDQCAAVTELLAEVVAAPAFAPAELAKEKNVVTEEIRTTDEDPEAVAVNLMLAAVYGEHPMGRPVTGTVASVTGITDQDLRTFYQTRYRADQGVVAAAGDVDHEALLKALTTLFTNPGQKPPGHRTPAVPQPPRVLVQTRKELTQVYVCLARPAFPYTDPRRHALSVLNTALGGGISSRLFQRLREDEGLVYSVASFVELYQDSGLFGIYFVADRRKLARCLTVLNEELAQLRRDRLSAAEFERARTMTKSSVLLALESPTSRMMRLARTHLMLGRTLTVNETISAYHRLTFEEVASLIDTLLPDGAYHAGVVGPVSQAEVSRLVTGTD